MRWSRTALASSHFTKFTNNPPHNWQGRSNAHTIICLQVRVARHDGRRNKRTMVLCMPSASCPSTRSVCSRRRSSSHASAGDSTMAFPCLCKARLRSAPRSVLLFSSAGDGAVELLDIWLDVRRYLGLQPNLVAMLDGRQDVVRTNPVDKRCEDEALIHQPCTRDVTQAHAMPFDQGDGAWDDEAWGDGAGSRWARTRRDKRRHGARRAVACRVG